ncbi:MAG: hypothetical protein K0S76_264 [Herbinix sp.]|jgi:hypothetical protein|nr:hypothetical protein [Herbinix sp.]
MLKNWVYEPLVSYYDSLLFYNSISRYKDPYSYKPIAIAKREEIGLKYRFLCVAVPKEATQPTSHFALIEIYKSEKGMPYITRLHRISSDHFLD